MEFETSGEIPGNYLNKVFSVREEAYEAPVLRLQMALIIARRPKKPICAILEKFTALLN